MLAISQRKLYNSLCLRSLIDCLFYFIEDYFLDCISSLQSQPTDNYSFYLKIYITSFISKYIKYYLYNSKIKKKKIYNVRYLFANL